MNDRSDNDRLLSDILAEAGAGDARAALLRHTLRLARRRRGFRQARRAGPALAVAAAALLVLWRSAAPRLAPGEPPGRCARVQTQSLPPAALVNTHSLSPASFVLSTSAVAVVSTETEPRSFEEIEDAALLALAAPNSPVLVRLGPHAAELVLAQPLNAESPDTERQ